MLFRISLGVCWLIASVTPPFALAQEKPDAVTAEVSADDAAKELELIGKPRQITFAGLRAGEGYFSSDGKRMVFQSEQDPANPFYQIFLMDLETGDVQTVSPGFGKTTCGWIAPSGDAVLFASTQGDADAKQKQLDELELRASGKQRRYAWDYDPTYELYRRDLTSDSYTQLTDALGYDAEASYSPDGSQVVFASNREAYSRELTDREKQLFEVDPAFMIDLYIMDADGTNVRRLTDTEGYDGGPFFSPDGKRICWRRFSADGATAEIFTMNTDGTDARRLTDLGAMSWAPFFHPSGEYVVFTTNRHGFANFELYVVRSDGLGEPVRVTHTDGFDGLPVFLPDGETISWTSTRTSNKRSQIYMASWNDAKARELLKLSTSEPEDRSAGFEAASQSTPEFTAADIGRHVDYLTRPELGGRLTGTEGERRATAYVAAYLESLGFEPAGENGTFFQEFDFPAGASLGDGNRLTIQDADKLLDEDWRPLSFSGDGETVAASVVFVGYGLAVPPSEGLEEYDSYVHLDVAGKWVMVLRDLPQDITPERRQQLARYSSPRRKASVARDNGAIGIMFAAGPTSQVKSQLIRFDSDASQAGVSIGVVSVSNAVAAAMLQTQQASLAELQKSLDDGEPQMGMALDKVTVSASVHIDRKTGVGRNVLARFPAVNGGLVEQTRVDDQSPHPNPLPTKRGESGQEGEVEEKQVAAVIVGAHIDHLGRGVGSNSLANENEQGQVHAGADDNASGVAAMLEIAQYLATEIKAKRIASKRDVIVAAWSGEELGLFGSQAFASEFYELYPNAAMVESELDPADPHAGLLAAHAHGMTTDAQPLTAAIAAYVNLDMVGRLREKLIIQGIGSSPGFAAEVQRRNVPVGLALSLDKTSTRLPTDAATFVARDVPILSVFTGAHEDYHTPRDTADKLNYEGAADIAKLCALLMRGFLTADAAPAFELAEGERQDDAPRVNLTAYMGTIPDYAAGDVKGLKLSGVAADGPAAKGGVRGGDVIVELAGRKVEDIYDYTYAIEALKIGEEVEVVVRRGEEKMTFKVTPTPRE